MRPGSKPLYGETRPHPRRGSIRTAVTVALLLALTGLTAKAQAPSGAQDLGAIYLCNTVVLRIRTPGAAPGVLERRAIVNERIIQAYATQNTNPENITVRQVSGGPAIFVGSQLIITVTAEDARVNNTTPQALAQAWLGKFKELLDKCRPDRRPPGS